jgi:hypothetical protein
MNVKKLLLSALALLFTVAFSYAQTAQTPDAKGKAKADGIAKAIDTMIKNKAAEEKKPAVDPKALLSAAQKQGLVKAYTAYYMGQDTLKMKREAIIKGQADMKAKADEINTKVASINAIAGKTVETEEEGAKIKAEIEKGNEEVNKMKADVSAMQATLGKDAEALKAYPAELENRLDTDVKKVLNAEQNKFYDNIKAQQKAKKGS